MIRLKSKVLKLLYKTLIIMHFLMNRRDKVCFKLDQIQMNRNYESIISFFKKAHGKLDAVAVHYKKVCRSVKI